MTILSYAEPAAEIACALPPNQMRDRHDALGSIVGADLLGLDREGDRLQVVIARGGRTDLDAQVITWAREEKACCGFLGFAVDSKPDTVTIEITAPAGAGPTLDGIHWIVRAASGHGTTAGATGLPPDAG
jgi:hypothetical protein